MTLDLEKGLGRLREWCVQDVATLARHANNRNIWLGLRDLFPHPYSPEDAMRFISAAAGRVPATSFAIVCDEQVVGSVGLRVLDDVERVSAELGYWIAEPWWGRGVATAAVRAIRDYAFTTLALTRIFAVPYDGNAASARVLEKADFRLEGRMRRAVIKDGRIRDQLLYAITDEDWAARAIE
jgi:RimJ/RimL family protein N-acetyltransferase